MVHTHASRNHLGQLEESPSVCVLVKVIRFIIVDSRQALSRCRHRVGSAARNVFVRRHSRERLRAWSTKKGPTVLLGCLGAIPVHVGMSGAEAERKGSRAPPAVALSTVADQRRARTVSAPRQHNSPTTLFGANFLWLYAGSFCASRPRHLVSMHTKALSPRAKSNFVADHGCARPHEGL